MLGFKILVSGVFNKEQLTISYKDKEKRYPEQGIKLVEKIWQRKKSSGIRLYDGKLFEVVSYGVKDQVLFLQLQNTSYRYLVGTGDREFISSFGANMIANPLSVGAVVVTSDNRFVVGKRRTDLYFDPGRYSIVAGTMDREKDFTDGTPDPFKAILRELSEEKGVKGGHILEVVCLGLIYNVDYSQTYMPFSIMLDVSSEVLKDSLPLEQEFEEFIYVEVEPDLVFNFLMKNRGRLSQTCLGNILLFSKRTFGETWLDKTLSRLKVGGRSMKSDYLS